MDTWIATVLTGVGATALTDLWALARRRWLAVAPPDFGLVGRWMAHMRKGTFRHQSITSAPPVRHERAIGWTAHYLIGIAFAALLPLLWGPSWVRQPTAGPALLVGIATLAAPFLIMQPGMGAGLFARHAPHPTRARLHSLLTHAVFGIGLYATALLLSQISTR